MRTLVPKIAAVLALAAAGCVPSVADAQGMSSGPRPYSGADYLPYAGGAGGFIPYQGGLGVMAQPRMPAPSRVGRATAGMGLMRSGRGTPRGSLTPLRALGLGSGIGMGMGMTRRTPGRAGGMGSPTRPPVGYYPFRMPASFGGPGASIMGM